MIQQLDTRPESLARIERKARSEIGPLSREERVKLLRECRGAWSGEYFITYWLGGVYDTVGGTVCRIGQKEFADELRSLANLEIPKGSGPWFTLAVTNGGARDDDVDCITGIAVDADKAGDWDVGNATLNDAGVAYIAKRSSRHTPKRPKFHTLLPLVLPFSGPKAEWRQTYRHLTAALSELYGFGDEGFDRAPDRMAQPIFPATKQTRGAVPAEVVLYQGYALDAERFLSRTGFEMQYSTKTTRGRRAPRGQKVTPVAADVVGLMGRAFKYSGMVNGATTCGALRVKCPWDHGHTTGKPFNGSTVVFAPRTVGGPGYFYCAHAYCVGRDHDQRLVLAALPPAALAKALREGGYRD